LGSRAGREGQEVMQYPVVVRVDAVQGKGGLRRRERNEKREHDQRNH